MSAKDRYSMPFFFDGNLDSVSDRLSSWLRERSRCEKLPVTVEGHMLRKFEETIGIDDTAS